MPPGSGPRNSSHLQWVLKALSEGWAILVQTGRPAHGSSHRSPRCQGTAVLALTKLSLENTELVVGTPVCLCAQLLTLGGYLTSLVFHSDTRKRSFLAQKFNAPNARKKIIAEVSMYFENLLSPRFIGFLFSPFSRVPRVYRSFHCAPTVPCP